MPHIVLGTKVDLDKLQSEFQPIFVKNESMIKITDMYTNHKKWTALFPTMVIDEKHQEYFIELSTRESKTTIRLYPLTDPEKTDSVKRSLVLVFEFIKNIFPDVSITKTNLQGYISLDTAT